MLPALQLHYQMKR